MRRVFLFNVIAIILVHIVCPIGIYLLFGFNYEYAPVATKYVYLAAALLAGVLIFTSVLIVLYRNKREIELEDLYESNYLQGRATEYLFITAIIIYLINIIKSGDFDAVLSGSANGTIMAYLLFFLDIRVLYFCVLIKAYKKRSIPKILFWSILYVALTLIYSSRAGILWMVLFNVWIIYGVKIPRNIKKKLLIFICSAVLIAPLLFMYATNARANERLQTDFIAHKLVARISFDEIAGIELEQYIENRYDKALFDKKYNIVNQVKQIVNAVVPGDVFENDVQPNQYWRAIFSTWSEESCKMYYMSMTTMLPMYLIIKYGLLIGFLMSPFILFGIYFVISKMKDPVVCIFLTGIVFYTVFQYFDWCYHFQDLYCFILTFLMIKLVSKLTGKLRIGDIKL